MDTLKPGHLEKISIFARDVGALAVRVENHGDLIAGSVLTSITDTAESFSLVSRQGMKSGIHFVCHEKELADKFVSHTVSLPVLNHIFNEAHRAVMIATRDKGYIPREHRLYGKIYAPKDWKPLFS